MTKSLLIGLLLLTSAASASAQTAGGPYRWVPQTSKEVPSNAVQAPVLAVSMVACRGRELNGRLWAGWLDLSRSIVTCVGKMSGATYLASNSVEVLTIETGTPIWSMASPKSALGAIGSLPTNQINAGLTYNGLTQVLCAYGGYVGYVSNDRCEVGGVNPLLFNSVTMNATVLSW